MTAPGFAKFEQHKIVLNTTDQLINGQREGSNAFLINGSDVNNPLNNGTTIVPNLDSIDEFR